MAPRSTRSPVLRALVCALILLSAPSFVSAEGSEQGGHWRKAVAEANKGGGPLTVVCIGDSNTEIFGYVGALRTLLQSRYGDRGIGYYTFGKRMEELPGAPKVERKGKWSELDFAIDPRKPAPPKPWLCMDGLWIETDDPEAEITVDVGYDALVRVHCQVGPGLGAFGITGAAKAKGPLTANCAADEPGYGVTAFEARRFSLKPASGKVALFGLDVQRPALKGGSTVHQIGNAWAMAHHFAAIEEKAYQRFFDEVKPALVTVFLGTNDMNNGWYPNEFRDEMRILLKKLRKTAPGSDILVMSYPSCQFDRKKQAKQFDAVGHEVAKESNCLFCSLHDYLGDNWRIWNHLGLTEWTLHFTPASGTAIALQMLKVLGFDMADPANAPAITNPKALLQESAKPAEHMPEDGWPQRPDR